MNYNKINRVMTVESHKRLSELHSRWIASRTGRNGPGSWGALFGTDRYKRVKIHNDKIATHFVWLVRQIIGVQKYTIIDTKDVDVGVVIMWTENI